MRVQIKHIEGKGNAMNSENYDFLIDGKPIEEVYPKCVFASLEFQANHLPVLKTETLVYLDEVDVECDE